MKIFLDGGDAKETKQIITILGFLDGQTTNPSLIAKNPQTAQKIASGKKFTQAELLNLYKKVVQDISALIPQGSVSVEVYADQKTSAEQMLKQGKEMYQWIANAHIKYPTTSEGLKAASESVKLGMRINMTLVFSQQQAAAVYAATLGGKKGQVYVSPFIGRLDDRGENGMKLVENIMTMFEQGDGHVEVLAASIRSVDHILQSLRLKVDRLTAPFKYLKEWKEQGMNSPDPGWVYPKRNLTDIVYEQLDLGKNWQEFNLQHDLTDIGLAKFASDWNALLK